MNLGRVRLASASVDAPVPPKQAQGAAIRRKSGDQRAQALVAAKCAAQQGEKMPARVEAALVVVGPMPAHVVLEPMPRKALDSLLEQGSLMTHDIGSAAVDNVGERRFRSGINVVRFAKHKMCRTAVAVSC
jgi:hypothetical protein